ncbi:hypothetical protein WG906_06910 [Pedobacter sp. P351]|uniref:hypothetical protein n=1 Tax=Pedobacter superstes TaxID=3133441 RepID=UPI0030A803A1
MNYLRYTIISLLFLNSTSAFSCDICGCFMGITPYDNQSNIGVLYRYRSFNGYEGMNHDLLPSNSNFFIPSDADGTVPHHHHGDPSDYEIFRTMEIRGRYFIHQRVELNAIVPYNSNSYNFHGNTTTLSGLGDVNVYGGYHLIRKLQATGINQRLIAGAGLKIPSGKHDLKNNAGDRFLLLNQPGTGSTDGFIYLNYMVGYKKMGLSWNASYKFNGQNNLNESIANSTTQFVNLFYTMPIGKNFKAVPSIQTFYEYSKGEKLNSILTGEHEMNNLMTGLGLDLFYKNIALNTGFQLNAYSAPTEHLKSAGKVHFGITYNFNQLYYLINKK